VSHSPPPRLGPWESSAAGEPRICQAALEVKPSIPGDAASLAAAEALGEL
jgi:hypothetical protein